jgi:aryl-alcohol dehydrogenase-like predicted oxidoreductase
MSSISLSRIVYGGASLIRISQAECNKLLSAIFDSGVTHLDTAPLYDDSESKIGSWNINAKKSVSLSTKVGLPNLLNFTPEGVRAQVDTSLTRLKVESIDTLFIHSVPALLITEEIIETLYSLKIQGKIRRFGYSGDGKNLKLTLPFNFDVYMATLNIVDQGNIPSLKKIETEIYLKRILANGVFNQSRRRITFKQRNIGSSACPKIYKERFNHLFKHHSRGINFQRLFIQYAASYEFNSRFLVGTANIKHFKEILETLSSFEELTRDQIELYSTKFSELQDKNVVT